jgi:uncharacterized protein
MSFHSSLPFAAITATLLSSSSFGALIAGDVAIVGFQASGVTTDSVSFVALVDLAPGTVLYFTDNGWTGSAFRGASATDGDGNENLMRFTVVNTIVAGTIIGSRTSSADYVWALSGLVGPGTSAYAQLSLSSTGEQVTILESTNPSNPIFSDFTALYNFDNTSAYEAATTSATGSLAPGLVQGTSAVLLTSALNSATFNLGTLTSGTQAEWLAAIGNASNWTTGTGTADAGSGFINVVPAPGALALLACAGMAGSRRRRSAR